MSGNNFRRINNLCILRAVMMRINAARKSILADNSEQFRTIQREKNPTSRKQVPRSKKPPTKNVESFETELLDEIVKFSEKETLSLEACQHIATKPGIYEPLVGGLLDPS